MALRLPLKGSVLIIILLLSAASLTTVSAADIPSHVEPSVTADTGFYFPSDSPLFISLGALSKAIMTNVSAAQWKNASANYENYSKLIDDFQALGITRENEASVVASIQLSKEDLGSLIGKAQRFDELNRGEQVLLGSDPAGNDSQHSVIEMRGLASDIEHLTDDLRVQYAEIATFLTQNGLDGSPYTSTAKTAAAYATRVKTVVDNAAAQALPDTTITLNASPAKISYGGTLRLSGIVQANGTGAANGTVEVSLDGITVMQASTNASGYYAGDYTVRELSAGPHRVTATFKPMDTPFNPSNSSAKTVTVGASGVNNTMHLAGGSLLGNTASVAGTVVTDTGVPVKNAQMTLYVNDRPQGAPVLTDDSGSYVLRYSQTYSEYLSSLFVPQKYALYTVFTPTGQPLNSANSTAATMASGEFGPFAIVGVLVVGILTAFFVHRRVSSGVLAAEAPEPAVARPFAEATLAGDTAGDTQVIDQPSGRVKGSEEIGDGIVRAKELVQDGQAISAIRSLYSATIRALSYAYPISFSNDMTAREVYFAATDKASALRAPFKTLTCLYELASYSDKPLSTQHASWAIEAASAIKGQIEARGEIS